MSKEFAAARMRNPHHNGSARLIREALREARGSLSIYGLHLATGLEPSKLRSAIADMITTTGGIVSLLGSKGEIRYKLYRAPSPESTPIAGEEFKRAGRITVGRGSKWGAGLV